MAIAGPVDSFCKECRVETMVDCLDFLLCCALSLLGLSMCQGQDGFVKAARGAIESERDAASEDVSSAIACTSVTAQLAPATDATSVSRLLQYTWTIADLITRDMRIYLCVRSRYARLLLRV
jgi:hypothetical protein